MAHVLNQTAGVLWQCIDGVSPLGEILSDVSDAFQVPLDVLVNDIVPVVAAWKRDQLVGDNHAPSASAGDESEVTPRWRRLVDPPND